MKLPEASTTASSTDTIRIVMFLDKQCNGATAGATEILETSDFQSFNNLANKSRFRTLMDRTYVLNASIAGNGTANESAQFGVHDSFFKKVNIPIEFDSTAGAITEIRSNNIGVMIMSQFGLVAFDSKIRLRFSDN